MHLERRFICVCVVVSSRRDVEGRFFCYRTLLQRGCCRLVGTHLGASENTGMYARKHTNSRRFGRTKMRPYKALRFDALQVQLQIGLLPVCRDDVPHRLRNRIMLHSLLRRGSTSSLQSGDEAVICGDSDAPRCVPTRRYYSIRYESCCKRVLITR